MGSDSPSILQPEPQIDNKSFIIFILCASLAVSLFMLFQQSSEIKELRIVNEGLNLQYTAVSRNYLNTQKAKLVVEQQRDFFSRSFSALGEKYNAALLIIDGHKRTISSIQEKNVLLRTRLSASKKRHHIYVAVTQKKIAKLEYEMRAFRTANTLNTRIASLNTDTLSALSSEGILSSVALATPDHKVILAITFNPQKIRGGKNTEYLLGKNIHLPRGSLSFSNKDRATILFSP